MHEGRGAQQQPEHGARGHSVDPHPLPRGDGGGGRRGRAHLPPQAGHQPLPGVRNLLEQDARKMRPEGRHAGDLPQGGGVRRHRPRHPSLHRRDEQPDEGGDRPPLRTAAAHLRGPRRPHPALTAPQLQAGQGGARLRLRPPREGQLRPPRNPREGYMQEPGPRVRRGCAAPHRLVPPVAGENGHPRGRGLRGGQERGAPARAGGRDGPPGPGGREPRARVSGYVRADHQRARAADRGCDREGLASSVINCRERGDEGESSQAGRAQEDEDGEDLQGRH